MRALSILPLLFTSSLPYLLTILRNMLHSHCENLNSIILGYFATIAMLSVAVFGFIRDSYHGWHHYFDCAKSMRSECQCGSLLRI